MFATNQREHCIGAVCCVLLVEVFVGFMANYPRQGWAGWHVAAVVVMAGFLSARCWPAAGLMHSGEPAPAPEPPGVKSH